MFTGSESALSPALKRLERQGEDDSVVVLAAVQPIRQADWQCSLVAKQRSLTHEHTHTADWEQKQTHGVTTSARRRRVSVCVSVCCVHTRVSPAPPFYRDIARRHKAPLYMLWRKHYQFTQKPLCLQAWGGGGGGGWRGWQASRCFNLAWTSISTHSPSPSLSRPAAYYTCMLTLNINRANIYVISCSSSVCLSVACARQL